MFNKAKPAYKHVIWNTRHRSTIRIDRGEKLLNTWHYHPELELILLKGSAGTRIAGTSMENFGDNDLVLLGKNLPHAFLHDEKLPDPGEPVPEAIVIHFHENFLGNEFLDFPEFEEIHSLLVKARRGLCVNDHQKAAIIPLMEKCFQVSSLERIIILLEILKQLSGQGCCRTLQDDGLEASIATGDKRFNDILDYTYANFDEHISIEEVAKIANLTKESFCRYFKSQVKKTYIEFLTEFRINKACQLIRDNQQSIKEIGFACGFDSLSNFYYQFKKITKLSPLEFKSLMDVKPAGEK